MSKDIDEFDDLFRTGLRDLEVDTQPDDWEIIAGRLYRAKILYIRKQLIRAAAVIILLLSVAGGCLYFLKHSKVIIQTTNDNKEHRITPGIGADDENDDVRVIEIDGKPELIALSGNTGAPELTILTRSGINEEENHNAVMEIHRLETSGRNELIVIESYKKVEKIYSPPVYREATRGPTAPTRKWRFGTDMGGVTFGSNNVANNYLLRSSSEQSPRLSILNAPKDFNSVNIPKTNIKHKTPLSFGFSVGKYISDNWSISTGLTYTLLRSDWETLGTYSAKTRQYLHFAGIPLSVTYKITEWNKLSLYASAGGKGEINFTGQQRTELYLDNTKTGSTQTDNVRMKELQWSLGLSAGISYPVVRPISAFAEVGASYYFKNGSDIETIYTNKPFYLSPQVGLRLSF